MQKFKTLRQNLDQIEEAQLLEKLSAADPTGKWVSDFVHSNNPKFDGKSKKERIRMALGASYAAKRAKGKIKEEAEELKEEMSHSELADHHANLAKKYYKKSDELENRGDSYNSDHFAEVGYHHWKAHEAHKEAAKSGNPEHSKEAHAASKLANGYDVSESVKLEEALNYELKDAPNGGSHVMVGNKRIGTVHAPDSSGVIHGTHVSGDGSLPPTRRSPRAKIFTPSKDVNSMADKIAKYHKRNFRTEEVEQIDELSKELLARYAKSGTVDARMKYATGKDFERIAQTSRKPEYKAGAKEWADKYKSDARRRQAGVHKAIDRLAKEEVEQIDETPKVDRGLSDDDKVASRSARAKGYATGRAVDMGNTSGGQFRGSGPSPYKDSKVAQSGERKGMITKSAIQSTKNQIKSRLNKEEVELDEELTNQQKDAHFTLSNKHRLAAKTAKGREKDEHMMAAELHKHALQNPWYKNSHNDAHRLSKKLGVHEEVELEEGLTKDTGWKPTPKKREDEYGNPIKTQNVPKRLAKQAIPKKPMKEETDDRPGIHKVSVMVNHPEGGEESKIEKVLKVKASNQAGAMAIAKKHFGGKGYKVSGMSYHGLAD